MAGDQSEAAFAYHEPAIATVLNLTGFLLVLNIVNVCLDKLLYCGLIGQLFIGILWGTPGAEWLDRGMETAVQQLGYLGLIMLVYEGMLYVDATVGFTNPSRWSFDLNQVSESQSAPLVCGRNHRDRRTNGPVFHPHGTGLCESIAGFCSRCGPQRDESGDHIHHFVDH